ncbi:ribosome biogenesis factor YjgA [Biformimicrobium ophioploci]|uniref:Dual-action ribosomal maturation protein DarP n=1 Tax=Biformimicrobium ophioploci TaxID=3036711 RepID=A0ABQ6LX00_9GAMM|nr:ribosome biogenesis factor YjgA [Microbulbifer sp. NKW57]GMG86593.1 ribosome biogenesis factor YjgA [Microbulbifer sp. NKW57]
MIDFPDDYGEFDEDEPKSKTQVKKEMTALQELGAELAQLNKQQLATIPKSAQLEEALATWNRIKSREAKRRQMQFIGKLMRSEDSEEIHAALEKIKDKDRKYVRWDHSAEAWREKLLNDSNALGQFLDEYPQADRQQLRQLLRESQKEISQEKPPAAQRKLFRFIRDLLMEEES